MDDFTSLVPCYTFPTDSLEVQEAVLATNPLEDIRSTRDIDAVYVAGERQAR